MSKLASTAKLLRDQTRDRHDRLEQLPFFQHLLSETLPLESYVAYLRALLIVHSVLEYELARSTNAVVAAVWRNDMQKRSLLERDIAHFESRVAVDAPGVYEAAIQITESIRLRGVQDESSLLGYAYVLEGSTMGAQELRPHICSNFDLINDEGSSYLTNYGPERDAKWTEFKARLDDAVKSDLSLQEQLAEAATEAYAVLSTLFAALHPLKTTGGIPMAATLNPEAGRHPIPSDPRELKAALQAADRCLKQFPYFEMRYGARGRRFSQSDSAWLATLCELSDDQLIDQVMWLGRVLATRGMPRITLEAHLRILHEELVAAVPEKRETYDGLFRAAVRLQNERTKWIDNDVWQSLTDDFESQIDEEWRLRSRGTGDLLLSAVCDELAGIDGAVSSIQQWLTDVSRFPETWVTAVQETIRMTRERTA